MENMNVAPLRKDVEDNSEAIIKIVNEIIDPYCKDLDNYVSFIRGILQDGNNAPTNDELDDFCMNLSTLIYFASGMCEQLGIRDDISRAIYKEAYHSARSKYDKGTVADKNSLAELEVQHEEVVNIAYSRSYKILKAKIDSAQELLASCKKILGRRITEMELTRLQR
jgi:hypothetical protein